MEQQAGVREMLTAAVPPATAARGGQQSPRSQQGWQGVWLWWWQRTTSPTMLPSSLGGASRKGRACDCTILAWTGAPMGLMAGPEKARAAAVRESIMRQANFNLSAYALEVYLVTFIT